MSKEELCTLNYSTLLRRQAYKSCPALPGLAAPSYPFLPAILAVLQVFRSVVVYFLNLQRQNHLRACDLRNL